MFFQNLATARRMHPEVLWNAVAAISRVDRREDASELVKLERALSASNDEGLRRIALAALIARSQTDGWNDDRIARLVAFRNDPSSLVAETAQFTLLPDLVGSIVEPPI